MEHRFTAGCGFRTWITRAERAQRMLRPSPWGMEAMEILSRMAEEGLVERMPPSATGEPRFRMTPEAQAIFNARWRAGFWGSN